MFVQTWKDALAADEETDVDSVARHVVHHVVSTALAQYLKRETQRILLSSPPPWLDRHSTSTTQVHIELVPLPSETN
jgi:hypothetical protein